MNNETKRTNPIFYGKQVIKTQWALQGTMVEITGSGVIVAHPVDYMNLCTGLHLWDSALDTLKEIIHFRIDTNAYS